MNGETTLHSLFERQRNFTESVLGIHIKDDPLEFYYSISGIVQESNEALEEDTRWKEIVFRRPGYKYNLSRSNKVLEISDILIYWINACLYSNISVAEIISNIEKDVSDHSLRSHYGKDIFHTMFIVKGKMISRSTNINISHRGDNPLFFFHAINDTMRIAFKCLDTDTRYKYINEYSSNGPSCNIYQKIILLCDVLWSIIAICLYSDITSGELITAVNHKMDIKQDRFLKIDME